MIDYELREEGRYSVLSFDPDNWPKTLTSNSDKETYAIRATLQDGETVDIIMDEREWNKLTEIVGNNCGVSLHLMRSFDRPWRVFGTNERVKSVPEVE